MNHPPITDAAITAASMSLKPSIRPYEIQLCLNRLCETNSGSAHILERYIHQLESMLIGNDEQDEKRLATDIIRILGGTYDDMLRIASMVSLVVKAKLRTERIKGRREGLEAAAVKLEEERLSDEEYGHGKAAVALCIEAIRAIDPEAIGEVE